MRILAITVGALNEGSTQYRIGQYLPMLEEAGITVDIVHRNEVSSATIDAALNADLVYIQKSLFDIKLQRGLANTGIPMIYDYDDAIWTRPGKPHSFFTGRRVRKRLHFWLHRSQRVLAANHYLANYAEQEGANVEVLPMALDTDVWKPIERDVADEFVVGWAGSPGTLPYLEALAPALQQALEATPQMRLRVYCGKRPDFGFDFEHVPYAPGTEQDFSPTLDLGLLPLPDTDHARGKSPIKSIQYLACGVPVLGNFVGATAEICRPEFAIPVTGNGWAAQLAESANEREHLRRMGQAGRAFIEATHSRRACGARLIELFRSLAAGQG
jgi:glycosyltransferase involved in cell wall biosynthesis